MKRHRLIKNGRPVVYLPSHSRAFKSGTLTGYVYEHLFVAESLLGRALDDKEVVHHRDHNKVNNDPANILVFPSNAEHSRFHSLGLDESSLVINPGSILCSIRTDIIKERYEEKPGGELELSFSYVCDHCGSPFTTKYPRKLMNNKCYCSASCYNISNRVVDRPSVEQIRNDLLMLGSYLAVGRKYGVSDNAVRKWLRTAKN